jgi:predicted nucleic acid-binding protein
MKLFLDTTYFLPAIGVSTKSIEDDVPLRILAKGHDIAISDLTLFELSAIGAKYVASRKLPEERVIYGIRSVTNDERITKVSPYNEKVMPLAFYLRGILSDFIDCLILASAIKECDTLATEDSELSKITEQKSFAATVASLNKNFKIAKAASFL